MLNRNLLIFISIFISSSIHAQQNPIVTAVSFLNMNYYPKIEGVAGIGAVSPMKYNEVGMYKNPALLNDNSKVHGILGAFSNHMAIANVYSGAMYYSPRKRLTVGYIYNYFGLDEQFIYPSGVSINTREFYQSIRCSYSISQKLKGGLGIKHLHSNMGRNQITNDEYKINSYAFDLGLNYSDILYSNEIFVLNYDLGGDILNIGSKVSYSPDVTSDFIPTTLDLGFGLSSIFKFSNEVSIGFNGIYQASKYLVPTPPVYVMEENGNILTTEHGEFLIESGKDPNVSALKGMIQSFNDAPNGAKEEFQEIMHRFGFEAWLNCNSNIVFVFRYGKFLENELKGNRKIRSLGFGFSAYNFSLDLFTNKFTNSRNSNAFGGISLGYKIEFNSAE